VGIILLVFSVFSLMIPFSQTASAQVLDGTVDSFQKISATQGGFGGSITAGDAFGRDVENIGDLDGDGVNDLAVGALGDDDGGTDTGAVYILFMDSDGTVKSEQKISDTAGGFTGVLNSGDHFGTSVASLGDLDGTGSSVLAVGAIRDNSNTGAVHILFLNSDGTVQSKTKIANGVTNFGSPLGNGDFFGSAVANMGDIDGDGVNDLAVGADLDDEPFDSGAVYIIFLTSSGAVNSVQKLSSNSNAGVDGLFLVQDQAGRSLANMGDLDGAGSSVVALAVGVADGQGPQNSNRGAVQILFLDSVGKAINIQEISSAAGGFGGTIDNGDQFQSVENIGDLNGDGVNDLAIGAPFDDDGGDAATCFGGVLIFCNKGAVWILFLNSDGTVNGQQKISDTEGGFTGVLDNFDAFGFSVANLGDLDGDGVPDIAVGAPSDDDGGTDTGAVYILFMNGVPSPPTPDLHPSILSEVQNIEEKLDGNKESLITQINIAITSIQITLANIVTAIGDVATDVAEILVTVTSIEENMNLSATKSLIEIVPAAIELDPGILVIGAPDSEFANPDVTILNPFDPPRDSNIKICVDATSFAGTLVSDADNLVRLKLDVAGGGDFSIFSEKTGAEDQGPKKGVVVGKLKNVVCFEVAAKEFQLVFENAEADAKNVEVAIIWTAGKIIIP